MDVTTMPSTLPLIERLSQKYPAITFEEGSDFLWNPTDRSICYDPLDPHLTERLLHELSHAELGHSSYESDIELIALERDAWHHAKTTLAPQFSLQITSDIIEDDLDTYRDWLHARSLCPHCKQNGIQTDKREYMCLICQTKWRVNEAIGCALRRYVKKNTA